MQPIFKNVTKYNKKNYDQFVEFHNNKYGFSYNIYTIIMTILLVYCITFNVFQKDLPMAILFLGLLVLFLLFRIYLPVCKYQNTQEKYTNIKQNDITFSFYKYYFTVNTKTVYYFKLYRVFETEDYFYLYIDDENAAAVNKNGFKIGTSEEFTKFIKKKCLFKYSKQTKK